MTLKPSSAFEVLETIDDRLEKGTIWVCLTIIKKGTEEKGILFIRYKKEQQKMPKGISQKNSYVLQLEQIEKLIIDKKIKIIQ